MNSRPTGTVTFLFTDIEGSTKLAQAHPDKWDALQQRHHAILQSAIESHNGYVFQIIGDAFCAAFHTAKEGINAAIGAQRNLQSEDWGDTPVKVRIGIHTGEAELQSTGDYHGYLAMSRVQRLMSAGHGGQVLISQATQELIRDDLPKDISLRDLGEKRLKDLIRPERIYQLDIADLPVDFPALKTLDKYRHNLPVQLTSFIGREKEMAEIKTALNEHRLITLTGSGGAGKTRLSLQVAADLLDQFPNGIWFVELASITDPYLIPQTILSAADMQTQQGKSALDCLKDFLREKTLLLVLDNCEHMIEACAKLADTLLHSAPNLKILASSREALGVRGEQSWHVPSLSIPDVKHLPAVEQLSQYEAVRLFIDRALLVQPHFAVTNDNAPAVAQICSRLDGIPLAIELAAPRVKVLKVEQIAERLNDRFRLLTGESRTALPRQQTLRAMIDWSFDLLSEDEKLLLRRLSVCMGGWTLEAAEQVCSDDSIHTEDVLDLLTRLVDKSLVVIDEVPTQLRYRMLETVRQYAREKLLESGEGEKLQTRHLAYFLKFAEEAEPHLSRREQLEWFERLELDHDNLRTALEWAIESRQDELPEAGLRLANALYYFWLIRGYRQEATVWFEQALSKSSQMRTTVVYARALAYQGNLIFDNEKSKRLANESLVLCRQLKDKKGIAFALLVKGSSIYGANDQKEMSLLKESLNLYLELDEKAYISLIYFHLGQIAHLVEYNPTSARNYYRESLRYARASGDRRRIALALNNIGDLAMHLGDLSAAHKYFEESLSLGQELEDKAGIIIYKLGLGEVALGYGDYPQSKKLLEDVLHVAQDLGNKLWISVALFYLGQVAYFQGDLERGINLQEESLTYSQEINAKKQAAWSHWSLGALSRLQGQNAACISHHIEALTILKGINEKALVPYILEDLAALNIVQGNGKRAVVLFGIAESIREFIHFVLFPIEKFEVDKNIASARAQLDEAIFNAAWAEGRAMKIEDAIEYALKELEK